MSELEAVSRLLKGATDPSWEFVFRLLRLLMRLLGFDFVRGARCHTPTYHQTPAQHYTTVILEGGDVMQDYYDRQNTVSVRQRLVDSLKARGLDDFKISVVLNPTSRIRGFQRL